MAAATAVRRVRGVAVVFALVQFGLYQAPAGIEMPFPRWPVGIAVAGWLLATNLLAAAVARRGDVDRMRRLGFVELALDTVAALIIIVLFGFDESSRMWPILVFPILEGAMRGAFRGALITWASAAAVFAVDQVLRLPTREDPASWVAAIPWAAGILLFVALGTGTLAERLRDADQQTEREKERLRSMSAVGRLLATSRDPAEVHQMAVDTAVGLIGWPHAALYEHVGDDLWLRRARRDVGATTEDGPEDIPAFTSLLADLEGPTVLPVEGELRRRAELVLPGAQHAVLIPLRGDGDLQGLLIVGTTEEHPDLPEDADDVLTILASHVTVALRTARLAAAEERTIAELRELDRVKDDFLSILTHELRSPMTTMSGSASLLRARWHEIDDTKRERFLSNIERNTFKLSKLIDDVFDALRAEQTELPVALTEVDLRPLLVEAADTVSSSERHHLDLHVDPDAPTVCADPARVEQILDNLVSNAIKYSPQGGTIRLCFEREGDHGVLTIADDGIGIPVEERDRLFGRFQRLHREEGIAGTGLGLYLVKTLVDAMNGTIEVDSAPDEGTTFRVRLPVAQEGIAGATAG